MKKYKIGLFWVIIFFTTGNNLFSQNTEKKVSESFIANDSIFNVKIDSLRRLKQYNKIIDLYNVKISLDSNDYALISKSASYYALSGDTIISIQRILSAYKKNIISPESIITNSDFNPLHTTQGWHNIINLLVEDYLLSDSLITNKELSVELWLMLIEDQRHRSFSGNFKEDSPESIYYYPPQYSYLQYADLRLKRLEKIIKKYGWPNRMVVGKKAGGAAFFVIQHSSPKTIGKYLPLVKQAVANDQIDKSDYALMLDRYLMNCGKKQLYGSQIVGIPIPIPSHLKDEKDIRNYLAKTPSKQYFLWPIENEKEVNKRRQEMGLENIEEYIKHWHLDYQYLPQNENRSVSEILHDYGCILKKSKGNKGFYDYEYLHR